MTAQALSGTVAGTASNSGYLKRVVSAVPAKATSGPTASKASVDVPTHTINATDLRTTGAHAALAGALEFTIRQRLTTGQLWPRADDRRYP